MTVQTDETILVCDCGEVKESYRGLSSHVRVSKVPECKTTDLEAIKLATSKAEEPQEKTLEVPTALASEIIEWEPQDRFYVPEEVKQDGYRYRWLSEQYRDRRGMEHWETVKPEDLPEDFMESFVQGGKPIDGRLMRGNDMFLARMPEARAKGREKFIREKTQIQEAAAKSSMESKIGPHGFDNVEFQKERARPVQKEE